MAATLQYVASGDSFTNSNKYPKRLNHAPFRKSLKSLSLLYQFLNFKVLHRRLKYKSTFKLSTEVCNLILKCVTLWNIHEIPHTSTHKIFNLYSVGIVLGNNLILMAVTGQCACASRCLNRDSKTHYRRMCYQQTHQLLVSSSIKRGSVAQCLIINAGDSYHKAPLGTAKLLHFLFLFFIK